MMPTWLRLRLIVLGKVIGYLREARLPGGEMAEYRAGAKELTTTGSVV